MYPVPPLFMSSEGLLGLPTPVTLYSPSITRPAGTPPISVPVPPQRALGPAFATSLIPATPVVKRSDPLSATILTAQGRTEASPEFLNCCQLLAPHDPRLALTDNQRGITLFPHANLFPRQPTEHFRRDILGPLHASSTSSSYIPVFYHYMEALLAH